MDPMTSLPKYESVADRLQALIDEGIYEPGDRLPSIRELSRELGVSINTIRESYRLLESRGAAEAVSQSGHFVRLGPPLCMDDCMEYPDVFCDPKAQDVTTDQITRMIVTDAAHRGWVSLSTAEPDPELLPTRQITEVTAKMIRRDPQRAVDYELPDGPVELRQEIVKRLFRGGVTLGVDDVIITAGCLEAVFIALTTVCDPGDTVVLESPAFYLFYQLLAQLRLKAVEVPSRPIDGVDIDALDHVLSGYSQSRTEGNIKAALLIGNFTNPMGALMPDENKRAVAQLLSNHGVTLIEDDMYGELYYGTNRPTSISAFADPDLTLLAASFSKTIAPGFRIGWLAGGGELIGRARHTKLVTSIVTSKPAALGIAAFLQNGSYDRTLRAARAAYRENSAKLRGLVAESFPEGTTSSRPLGGMVLWVAMPQGVDALKLYEKCRAEGVTFSPGPMFSLGGTFGNCLRLNASIIDDRISEAVRKIGELAKSISVARELSA